MFDVFARADRLNCAATAQKHALANSSLPPGITRAFRRRGIVTKAQLVERFLRAPHAVAQIVRVSAADMRRIIVTHLGPLPDLDAPSMRLHGSRAPSGVSTQLLSPKTARGIGDGRGIARYLDGLGPLPTSACLAPQMQPVSSQGPNPFCVGFATDAMIEFLYQTALADCYLYAGSRSEPDFPKGVGAGSSFHFALKHACNTGHVKDRFYTMQDCITEKPVAPLKRRARDYRISGCVDLLDSTTNMTHLMRLIKATLSGNLTREMAPNLVGVSLVLYESFHSAASGQDGLISIPLDGERRSDNHAMVIVGYIDADHPSNPYGITLYLVRNSWGSEWASDNPYGFEGHALIPEAYFTRERVIEAYFAMI